MHPWDTFGGPKLAPQKVPPPSAGEPGPKDRNPLLGHRSTRGGTSFGAQNLTPFLAKKFSKNPFSGPLEMWQARAFYAMSNLFLQRGPAGKKAILINMDETPIQQSYPAQRGTIGVGRKRTLAPGVAIERLATTDKRGIITHVAFIAEAVEIQDKLPQVFIANRKLVPHYVQDEVTPHLPPNTRLWSGSSSWMNEDSMCRILRLLHESLRAGLQHGYHVLVLDMAAPRVVGSVTALAVGLNTILL